MMAKNWKSLIKQQENLIVPEDNETADFELQKALQELSHSSELLQRLLRERTALEEDLINKSQPDKIAANEDPRFSSEIVSINEKKVQDKKRFDAKKNLEEKIQMQIKEVGKWEKRKAGISEKVRIGRDSKSLYKRKKNEDFIKDKVDKKWESKREPSSQVKFSKNTEVSFEEKRDKLNALYLKTTKINEFVTKQRPKQKKINEWEINQDKLCESQKQKAKIQRIEKYKLEVSEIERIEDLTKNAQEMRTDKKAARRKGEQIEMERREFAKKKLRKEKLEETKLQLQREQAKRDRIVEERKEIIRNLRREESKNRKPDKYSN